MDLAGSCVTPGPTVTITDDLAICFQLSLPFQGPLSRMERNPTGEELRDLLVKSVESAQEFARYNQKAQHRSI